MKIEDTRSPRGPRAVQPGRAEGPERPAAPKAAADAASVMGIPEAELTPKVRQAILTLMGEVERLRQELERTQARVSYLEKLADQDLLAPIANRRAFVRELTRFLAFAERYGTPSSLIYLDVNGLKAINDTYGHAAGDAVLLQVAQTLVDNVRRSDVVARMGGDEFAVLLSHTDEATATEKARAVVALVEGAPLEWNGTKVPLSLAFGVHTFTGGEDTSEAIAAADRKMYDRKHGAAAK